MTPAIIATFVFASILTGAAVGLLLGKRLPEHHLDSSTKDVVRLSMGMIATMTALVLGLVTASAKSSFDAEDNAVKHTAAAVLTLDRLLADYGDETRPIRETMRSTLEAKVHQIWGGANGAAVGNSQNTGGDSIAGALLALTPSTTAQTWYRSRALDVAADVLESRWIIFNGTGTVPSLFLTVIVCWLTVLFGSFGLFAPRNGTVIGALLICALSVALSIFLILEMDDPFGGVMRISDAPLRHALAQIGH
jgi:hypothetical protein